MTLYFPRTGDVANRALFWDNPSGAEVGYARAATSGSVRSEGGQSYRGTQTHADWIHHH